MDYDKTWAAILQPGETKNYFIEKDFNQVDLLDTNFNLFNAWNCSEICRLTYKYHFTERKRILEENGFFNVQEMQVGRSCGLVCSNYDTQNIPYQVVAFKGTDSMQDWMGNIKSFPVRWKKGFVHKGFAEAYKLIEQQFQIALDNKKKIILTGHSLGGAIALLAATQIPNENIHFIYTFGAPLVGDTEFNSLLENIPVHNIANANDIVPKINFLIGKIKLALAGQKYIFGEKNNLQKMKKAFQWKMPKLKTIDPPMFASEHAPINYAYRLEKLIQKSAIHQKNNT